MARWRRLVKEGHLNALEDPSEYLQSHLIARFLDAEDRGEKPDLLLYLEQAAEEGHPSLVEEACLQLAHLQPDASKAGHP